MDDALVSAPEARLGDQGFEPRVHKHQPLTRVATIGSDQSSTLRLFALRGPAVVNYGALDLPIAMSMSPLPLPLVFGRVALLGNGVKNGVDFTDVWPMDPSLREWRKTVVCRWSTALTRWISATYKTQIQAIDGCPSESGAYFISLRSRVSAVEVFSSRSLPWPSGGCFSVHSLSSLFFYSVTN